MNMAIKTVVTGFTLLLCCMGITGHTLTTTGQNMGQSSATTSTVSIPPTSVHLFLYGDGDVNLSSSDNPFANNAIDGRNFLLNEMNFTLEELEIQKKLALDFWSVNFGVDGIELEREGAASIIEYQISPLVNERVYLISTGCSVKAYDYQVLDGGFQLLITAPEGVKGRDPVTGQEVILPHFTNLVFSWLKIIGCQENDLILPYRSASIAELLLTSVMFELNITRHENNPFGEGHSLGLSSPVISGHVIQNRLLNYITFLHV